jgi:hypothetical protein
MGVQLCASKLQLEDKARLLWCMINNGKRHGLWRRSISGAGYKYDGNVAYSSFYNKASKYRRNMIA